eukprot:UN24284
MYFPFEHEVKEEFYKHLTGYIESKHLKDAQRFWKEGILFEDNDETSVDYKEILRLYNFIRLICPDKTIYPFKINVYFLWVFFACNKKGIKIAMLEDIE